MDMSFQARPFAFDRVFAMPPGGDRRQSAPDVAALQAEIDLLKLQLETAVTVARVEGFEAGLAHARGETSAALLSATDALHVSIEAVEEEYAAIEERLSKTAAEVAMAAADGLAARNLDIDPTLAIDAAIGRVLQQVTRGQELHVHVHPDLIDPMEALIAARKNGERRRLSLTLVADPKLAVGDALISWEQGGLALDAAARRNAILTELGLRAPDTPDFEA
jgi:flagellar assembly protein FliH